MNKRLLQKAWLFLFEDWDLLLLLSGSFVVAILANIGIIPDTKELLSIILGALSLLAFSMTKTRTKFDKTVEKINRADIFESQEDMYKELETYIRDHRVREATLIQYSGQRVNRIVRQLVSQGADVTLFVQNKNTAQKYSKAQVARIKGFPEFIKTEFNEEIKNKSKGTLMVYDYDPPASLRAVKLDNKILAVGWYIYKFVDKNEKKRYPEDEIKLLGHNQPGKLLYFGSREYDVMSELFDYLVENFNTHIKLNNKKPIFEFGIQSYE